MIWVLFVASSVVIVLAAIKLAEYGDVIAIRTRLGGMFIGTLLLAMATSLPELLTTINSIEQEVPDLAAGNVFGSSMFNMFMLAALDLANRNVYMLRRIAITHTLTASMAVLLTGLAVLFVLVDVDAQIGWVGVDSLVLIAVYVGAMRLIQFNNPGSALPEVPEEDIEILHLPTLRRASLGFALATGVLVLATPVLVSSAADIAEVTGLGASFIGTTAVAIVTSLPELVTTVAAVRIGAYDLAVGNLFGSNVFNILTLGLADIFYTQGRFLAAIDQSMAVAGVTALLLTCMALTDVLARAEHRRFSLIGVLMLLGYFAGMWMLYS